MICVHVKKLYQLCETEGLKISSSDLVHIVCEQCGCREVCPSMPSDEYDAKELKQSRANQAAIATGNSMPADD